MPVAQNRRYARIAINWLRNVGHILLSSLLPLNRRVSPVQWNRRRCPGEAPLAGVVVGARSAPVFRNAKRFAVNVLAANQHHVSRQFATPANDKFADVACTCGPGGMPLVDGAIARFVCRAVSTHDGG
jgi:hypothetical protein